MSEVSEKEVAQETQEKEVEQKQEQEFSPDQTRAMKNGWRPKDEFKGDSDDWVSAKKFNERGEMIGQIMSLQRSAESQKQVQESQERRIVNQKKIHEGQMKATIADLESRRDAAIDDADREKANTIQANIDGMRVQETPEPEKAPKNDQHILDQWNKDNPWIKDTQSSKAGYALMRYNFHSENGGSIESAISSMESDVKQQFPDVNDRRSEAAAVEGGRSKPGGKPSTKLSWSQLTADEIKWYDAVPSAWKTKDDYLQAVLDERNL